MIWHWNNLSVMNDTIVNKKCAVTKLKKVWLDKSTKRSVFPWEPSISTEWYRYLV